MLDIIPPRHLTETGIYKIYSSVVKSLVNMQMVWLYLEFVCLAVIVLLRGLVPKVIVKQLGPTIVSTKYGKLRGSLVEFPADSYIPLSPVEAYLGVQYGSLHNGNLRFIRSSSPNEKWDNIHSAWDFKKVCPQQHLKAKFLLKYLPEGTVERITRINTFTKEQKEECLSLNLFVPIREWNETEKLPVMIFIHGESYEVGTGNAYDGSVLSSYGGVIVITVNYRLGVLGFLRTGDGQAEGNYALWDLIAILYWVKENIERFGGDAHRVTLFGHGHGAALVNLLLLTNSAMEYELFNNVILQSGSALSTWATSIDAKRCAHLIAQRVNCSHAVNDSSALVRCFRQREADELVRNVPLTPKYYTCFAPSIDKHMDGTMFPKGKSVEELIKSNTRFSSIKMMVGLTRKEAYSYLTQDEIENGISESRKKQIMRTYVQNIYKANRQKIYDILDHEYTQWEKPIDNFSRRDDIMDMLSDGQYKAPLIKMAQEHSKKADTYFYSFGYSTQSEDFPQWSGGVHGDELPYVFGAPLVGGLSPFPLAYTAQEMELSKFMMRMWTNFAKTGDPNLPEWSTTDRDRVGNPYYSDERWPKYNITSQKYLQIGRKGSKIREYYRGKETALWTKLIPKLNERDINSSDASHELDNSENMTTFDDPNRLISKFWTIFPTPPPPPYTPPFSDPMMDTSYVSQDTSKLENFTEEPVTNKPRVVPPGPKPNPDPGDADAVKGGENSSGVPLSVTVVIGCSLLFLNLLIFAGLYYYHRRRVAKYSSHPGNSSVVGDMHHVNENRNSDSRCNSRGNTQESINLVQTKDNLQPHPKVAGINHKPVSNAPPVYTPISKPVAPPQGPGGYNYSALPLKTSSPMHSQNQVQATTFSHHPNRESGPSSEDGSQASRGSNSNTSRTHGGPDQTPRVDNKSDPRTKSIPRGNHTVSSSNNAITIV